jgi:mannose-1-phosphate guanylyltransferase / phosphomannomutase
MNKAVIMAGGFGTRLRPLTMNIPKPMVPILNVPMIEHIINLLKKHGIYDIVSLLYFQPEKITSYFEDGVKFSVNLNYVTANADYGTAGSVKNAHQYLDDRFIIISGDVLTDFNLTEAIKFHIEKKSKATILLTRVPQPLQYGIVITDESGRITRFLEKPSWGEVFSDTINTGIYILEPEVLDLIPYQQDFDFSKDLFPLMLQNKMPLYGFISEGYWRDVGNLNEYQKGQQDALHGFIELYKTGINTYGYIVGDDCKIAPSAKFFGSVTVGNDVTIGEHTEISNSVIGDGVKIGSGCKIAGTTIWDRSFIGDFVELTNDVICNNCEVGDSVIIDENVFVADYCTIGSEAKLSPNIKLWPNKHVEEGSTLTQSMIQEEKWFRELFTDARITGISNIEINPEFAAKLGSAIGMTLGKNVTFLVSRDPDKVSRIIKRSITAGLSSVGINVNDLQTISIPQTRQELRTGRYAGGFHVRRSPRDKDKTDIIIFNKDGRDISMSRTKAIERYFFGEDIKRAHYDNLGDIYYPERTNEIYLKRFLDSLDLELIRKSKFKILIDYSFGLASTIFPSVLGKLGVDALSLNDYVDSARFHPDPTTESQENDPTGKIMRSLGYELGFRLEVGAEKISLIDERGVWYSPMRLLTIITKLYLESHRHLEPYKIAVSVLARDEIECIAEDYNVEIIRIKDSHMAMMEATRDESVRFVGGAYGGYIFSDFLFASDGMFSVGQILEMLSNTNYKISSLDKELPQRFQHKMEAHCPWQFKGTVMRRAMEYSDKLERQLVEGVKIFFGKDSVLLYPSKEKGAFNIIGESDQYDNAVSIARKFNALVSQWIEGV